MLVDEPAARAAVVQLDARWRYARAMGRSAIVVAALALLACRASPPPPRPPLANAAPVSAPPPATPSAERAVREIEALRDKACACTTVTCAEPLKGELELLGKRYQDTHASQDVMTHVATVTETLVACMLKLGVSM